METVSKYREKSLADLKKIIKEEEKKVFDLSMDKALGKLKDLSQFKKARKVIAQVKTIIREKEIIGS